MGLDNPSETSERAQQPDYVAVGRVVRPHGVRGNLVVEPISELIQSIEAGSRIYLGSRHDSAEVIFVKPHRDRYLLSVTSCDTREQADLLRDQEVFLKADEGVALPAGTYYQWQIVGLEVETDEGESLGRIERIIVTGANDVYVVRGEQGEELLLPAIEQVVLQVDLEGERMVVRLLPGLRPENPSGG